MTSSMYSTLVVQYWNFQNVSSSRVTAAAGGGGSSKYHDSRSVALGMLFVNTFRSV